jgi:hypothetical protein
MTWLRNSAGGYGHYFARLSVKSIIPIMLAVLAPLLFVLSGSRGVLVRAQLPPEQCHDAVIGHMEWVNSGDPQGRYALFPTGSGQNDNATGNLRDLRLKSSLFYLSRYSLTCVMTPCMCHRRMCSSYQL